MGAVPDLLKRATSPKASLFQSVGKGPVPRKAVFLEEMFEELVLYITQRHLDAGVREKSCQVPTVGKARLEINPFCFNFWMLNLTTVLVSLLALVLAQPRAKRMT